MERSNIYFMVSTQVFDLCFSHELQICSAVASTDTRAVDGKEFDLVKLVDL